VYTGWISAFALTRGSSESDSVSMVMRRMDFSALPEEIHSGKLRFSYKKAKEWQRDIVRD